MEENTDNKNIRNFGPICKKRIIIALSILLFAAVLFLFCFYMFKNEAPVPTGGDFYNQSTQEIQDAVDHDVEDGYFNMSINTNIAVYDNVIAVAGIQNIASNKYDCNVKIVDENNVILYESGGIAPGQELPVITLNQALDSDSVSATATFTIYTHDDSHSVVGSTAAAVTFYVI